MMKVGPRFFLSLVSAMFLFLVCFVPGALGAGADYGRPGTGSVVLSHTLPALFALAPKADLRRPSPRDGNDNNNSNGCAAQIRGRDKLNNCTTVPEGGTAFAYLSLVALGCLATGIFRSRRDARLRETE
jgi:hypothetical protein